MYDQNNLGVAVNEIPVATYGQAVNMNGVTATVFVSSYASSESASLRAFDGDYATVWHSSYLGTTGVIPSTIKIVFDSAQKFNFVLLFKKPTGNYTRYGGLCVYIKVSFLRQAYTKLSLRIKP